MPHRAILRLANPDGTTSAHEVYVRHDGDKACYSAPCSPGFPRRQTTPLMVRAQEAPEFRTTNPSTDKPRPNVKSIVWLKLSKWGQDVRNRTISKPKSRSKLRNSNSSKAFHTYSHSLDYTSSRPSVHFNTARLGHLTPSRPNLTLPVEEPPLSWMEMIGWTQPFSRGLNTITQEDGTRHVRCYYDDIVSRIQVKKLVKTTAFDDLLLAGFETAPGESRCQTIRLTLTPEKVRRFDLIMAL